MKSNYCVTISRQFGCGGSDIAKLLAEKLHLDLYNQDAFTKAIKKEGLDVSLFDEDHSRATSSLLYSFSMGNMGLYSFGNGFSAMGDLPINNSLYLAQHKIIKSIAQNGNCVILGRCANFILKDNPNTTSVFLHADLEYRKNYVIENYKIDKDRAEKIIKQRDKARANYYSFYSGQKWGSADNYDLCLNTNKLSTEQIISLITNYIFSRENINSDSNEPILV